MRAKQEGVFISDPTETDGFAGAYCAGATLEGKKHFKKVSIALGRRKPDNSTDMQEIEALKKLLNQEE